MIAQLILVALAVYLAIGVLFAIAFVTRLVSRIDPVAADGPIGFRLLIFPGAALLWPIVLAKVLRAKGAAT
jgi:hypothetical protein